MFLKNVNAKLISIHKQSLFKCFYLMCQQKQDQELTVAQTMNSLLPNSD